MPAVVHPNSIVDAVRESRLIAKAVDIIQVDGHVSVSSVESGARQGTQCTNKSLQKIVCVSCVLM